MKKGWIPLLLWISISLHGVAEVNKGIEAQVCISNLVKPFCSLPSVISSLSFRPNHTNFSTPTISHFHLSITTHLYTLCLNPSFLLPSVPNSIPTCVTVSCFWWHSSWELWGSRSWSWKLSPRPLPLLCFVWFGHIASSLWLLSKYRIQTPIYNLLWPIQTLCNLLLVFPNSTHYSWTSKVCELGIVSSMISVPEL